MDHNIPTTDRTLPVKDADSKKSIDTLQQDLDNKTGVRKELREVFYTNYHTGEKIPMNPEKAEHFAKDAKISPVDGGGTSENRRSVREI